MGINICYLTLNILFLMIARIYLKDKKTTPIRILTLLGIYLLFTILSYSYLNDVINSIFKLKFLDVKSYLILLITTNMIVLYTMNRSLRLVYKILNYSLFTLLIIILGAISSVVLGNKFNNFYIMDVKNAVNFIDLSFIIFILYLIIISLTYIGHYILNNKTSKEITLPKIIIPSLNFSKIKPYRKKEKIKAEDTLTPEQLLNYQDKRNFYIHGENASIIFEDSNTENIIKNYYILNDDIHAKLMNGYTLEENKILKGICTKLGISNLTTIDLNNASILNRISIDEYNLLKKVKEIN